MIPEPSSRREESAPANGVRTLTPAEISHLPIRNHPRLQDGDAESLVIQAPGLSKWHPESGEFVLVTPWRHRREIPSVAVMSAFRYEDALLSASIATAEAQGAAAFVLLESFEMRNPAFYSRNGMTHLETVLTYEHRSPERLLQGNPPTSQTFEPWFGAEDQALEDLLQLDHAAFPWLWRNSREEFRAYVRMPFVEIWVGRIDGRITSYVGLTHFRRWSHLDRIAIMPDVQGQGLGREALRFAIQRMMDAGAERVGLSTQRKNHRSRHMYENVGFEETPELNYDVYGILFEEGRRQMANEQGTTGDGE